PILRPEFRLREHCLRWLRLALPLVRPLRIPGLLSARLLSPLPWLQSSTRSVEWIRLRPHDAFLIWPYDETLLFWLPALHALHSKPRISHEPSSRQTTLMIRPASNASDKAPP